MRKFYFLLVAAMTLVVLCANAQTILEEDFELGENPTRLAKGDGWTTVNSYSGTNKNYNWHNYYSKSTGTDGSGYSNSPTITGDNCAACDGPIGSSSTDGAGPREEILLSPELDLNDTYELQFTWKVSPMNALDYSRYDFQVRVVVGDDLRSAETVFSIQDKNMLKESGVLDYPIETWDPHTSKVDLSDWKGEKVKIAFVYKMLTESANVVWLDDISVYQFTQPTGPVATISSDRYNFGTVYIGEKFWSDVFTLTNTGKNGLKVTSVDFPEGVSSNTDLTAINLDKNDKTQFQLAYSANSLSTPASGDVVLHTTGGDVKIAYSATKQLVPEGFSLETFNDYFPPAGWSNRGWSTTNVAIEGDASVYCDGGFSASYLTSPRLDLSAGGQVTFTYLNDFEDEEYSVPEYDVELQVSYDGGETWKTKWTSPYEEEGSFNKLNTVTVDLGTGTDNSKIRWYYPAVETDDEGAYPHSTFYIDRLLLPNIYGIDGVPTAATLVSPENGATNVYPRGIVLEWTPAQFADGYKIYVGSDDAATNLVNGEIVDGLTYTVLRADYETTFNWKVVPFNSKGEATSVPVWKFTTQPDASVMEFPYEENFDNCNSAQPVPTGWLTETTEQWENRSWQPNTYFPYGGNGASLATGWMYAGNYSTLTSPEFRLPIAGEEMSISFVWGDEHPRSLLIDETGLLKKQNVEGGNGNSDVVFEIYADGAWKQAAYLSENFNEDGETKYWRNEKIDLSEYAGKTVQFRWINHSYSSRHTAASIDNVVIDGIVGDKVIFNKTAWDAGKVNYEKAVNSGEIFTVLNDGVNPLKVKEVTFDTENFESSLAVGTEIPVNGGVTFSIQFNAKTAAAPVSDNLTIEFESGYKATFPVSGIALPENEYFQSFENNDLDHPWKSEFTTIDVDKAVTYDLGYYETIVENDGGRYAFTSVEHNNSNLTAHSGKYTVAAASIESGSADDWIVSPQLQATASSTFDFYARNLGTANSVFIGDNDYHSVGVYVSEKGNTSTSDFVAVKRDAQMPYLAENEWNHFEVDLSAYAGKNIYIAVRHTETSANWMAFFDDFTFKNFKEADSDGIQSISAISDNAQVEVFNLSGVMVQRGNGSSTLNTLNKGVYVVKVKNGNEVKTLRIARK